MKYKEYFEKFDDLLEFSKTINSRETAPFYKKRFGEMPSHDHRESFRGTKDWETAEKLLLEGDKETAGKMISTGKIKPAMATKSAFSRGPVGFVPNIPAYLAGNPNNMFSVKPQPYKGKKVINLVVNIAVGFYVSADDLCEFGAKVLGCVSALEKSGYRCNIYVAIASRFDASHTDAACLVKIKDSGKPLNLTKVAYPLANPSFFRRHLFRWIETTGKTNSKYYGEVLDDFTSKKLLTKIFRGKYAYVSTFDHYTDTDKQLEDYINAQL